MDVILHVGAHRSGTTTFQDYMRRNSGALSDEGIGYWGPGRTRKGLFSGLMPGPEVARGRNLRQRAEGRIKLRLARAEASGLGTLVVSDENMIGSVRDNLRNFRLYPAIGERMSRFARAFDGRLTRVMICIRSPEVHWGSAIAYGIQRGWPMPDDFALRKISLARRSWRDVITDLACALPEVEVRVLPFEGFAGRPDAFLRHGADIDAPRDKTHAWLNRAPSFAELQQTLEDRNEPAPLAPKGQDRWTPFSEDQRAELLEHYSDDIMWLTSGADGLATFAEDRTRSRAGPSLPQGAQTKGHPNEPEERHLAHPG
jgi:hypothetical protein